MVGLSLMFFQTDSVMENLSAIGTLVQAAQFCHDTLLLNLEPSGASTLLESYVFLTLRRSSRLCKQPDHYTKILKEEQGVYG
jgi:hypothetical protein